MSSLAAAPRSGGAARFAARTRRALASHPDACATLAVAAFLIVIAFIGRGGAVLARTTAVAIVLTLLGTAAVALALLVERPQRRLWGGATVLLFAALAGWTAISIGWSIQPDDSWQAANLTLSYLALFAGTVALAHIAADRWAGVLGGVVLAAVVLSGYALLVKVFPSLVALDLYARLRAPFEYWNAVGLMAALGIPGCLWLGARRDGHAALGALAVPALGLLLVALLLSEGRGPLLAALVACAAWFAAVPLRLRGVAVLTTAGAGAAVVCVWAFSNDALTTDGTPLDVRADAGHSLGLLLVAMLVVLLLAGGALAFAMASSTLSGQARTQLGIAVLVALALIPLAGAVKLAASDRGFTGSISHGWHQLTDPNAQQPPNDPSRFSSVGSVRARYWSDAFKIWRQARWTGIGADGYATARRPLQNDTLRVRHAHGYVPQTLADLGIVGMGLSALLLLAWFAAAGRATGLLPRSRQPISAERIGLMTLGATAIAFGVHSAVDWTWFIPGTAVTGLMCAAWVTGYGPPAEPHALIARPRWRVTRARLAPLALVLAAGLAGAWTIWQPQRSANANDSALDALLAGRLPQAEADARDAAHIDPLSLDPLLTLSAVQTAMRQPAAARATLERGVHLQPANAESWLRLGQLELAQGDPRQALNILAAAVYLDPRNPAGQFAYAQAQQAAGAAETP